MKPSFLVIRLSSLGDVLLTTPLLRAIKHRYPSSSVSVLVREQYADAVRFHPAIDRIIPFSDAPGKDNAMRSEIRSTPFDSVIDLQNNIRSRKITTRCKGKVYRFNKRSIRKFLLVTAKINFLKNAPQIPIRYAEAIPGVELDNFGLDFHFPPGYVPPSVRADTIAICPGARHFTKRWPLEKFVRLAEKCKERGWQVYAIGGLIDRPLCAEIAKAVPGVEDRSTENDLFALASTLAGCSAVVCNDSGLMHLAAALGKRIIALFGSSVREFGFFPYRSDAVVLENSSVECRPCSHIGKENCPKHHFRCLAELTPEHVFEQLAEKG